MAINLQAAAQHEMDFFDRLPSDIREYLVTCNPGWNMFIIQKVYQCHGKLSITLLQKYADQCGFDSTIPPLKARRKRKPSYTISTFCKE